MGEIPKLGSNKWRQEALGLVSSDEDEGDESGNPKIEPIGDESCFGHESFSNAGSSDPLVRAGRAMGNSIGTRWSPE